MPKVPLHQKTDVVFMLDASRNVQPNVYKIEKDFVKSLAGHFNLSPTGPRASAVIYGQEARTVSRFTDPNFESNLDSATLLGTPRRMDKALEHTARILATSRKDSRRIAILLTAGNSANGSKSLEEAIKPLRRIGAQTFVVVIGEQTNIQHILLAVDRLQDVFRAPRAVILERQSIPIARVIRNKPGELFVSIHSHKDSEKFTNFILLLIAGDEDD